MPHYPQPFREGAAKLQGTRCGQGSAAPELPKKSDVCAALRRTKAAGCTACNLGGTTEVLCLSSLSFGMKGIYFFPERIPLLIVNKEEAHGQKLVKGIHH